MINLIRFSIIFVGLIYVSNTFAITLSTNGNTEYVIVLAEDAIEPEQTAANELKSYLEKVTGAEFQIHKDSINVSDNKKIIIGFSSEFQKAISDVDIASLKSDGIVIKTVGENLYIGGGRPRGTIYAVYTFLEKIVGCRWWTSKESFIPEKPTLNIPDLNIVYVPKLQYREVFYKDIMDNPLFAVRCKSNGNFERVSKSYGGYYKMIGFVHTFFKILPPAKYFKEHPEWYSKIKEKRTAENSQLCLTNKEMQAEFLKQAIDLIKKEPDAGIISISQNDNMNRCECEICKDLETREGSPSGPLIHFVNTIAEEIQKEFPDIFVETLAYQYTRKPPKYIKPRDNVLIRLCSIECSFSQPLEGSKQNESFMQDLKGWNKISKHLFLWDYVANFSNYILPHPNFRVLAPNIRTFVNYNVIGLFEQGDSFPTSGDFIELRAWLLSHLMWDPSENEKTLMTEFLNGYYGPAADVIQQYIDLICDVAERSNIYLKCTMESTFEWFGLDDMNRATELFNKAQELVKNDSVYSKRVKRARLSFDNAWLVNYNLLNKFAKENNKSLAILEPAMFCENFIKNCYSFNVKYYAENKSFREYETYIRSLFQNIKYPLPESFNGTPEDDWIDIQEGSFHLALPGKWVNIVNDSLASNNLSASMPANHTQWAIQIVGLDKRDMSGKWRCYAVIRCDSKSSRGKAFQIGIYDGKVKTNRFTITEDIENISDGKYHIYDLGIQEITPNIAFWVAPMGNSNEIKDVIVDRFFFIKEK